MLSRIRHYWSVYREFVGNSFAEAMSYRLHFVLLITMDLLFYATSLASVGFIYDHVEVIGTWRREHFLFFVSFMLAVDHLHMTFVSENFWNFSYELRTGRLDFVLLKPLGAIFTAFFRFMRPGSLCNVWVPWTCLVHFGLQAGISGWTWAALPPLVVMGFMLIVSLEILLAMSMFWLIESVGINFLRMQLQQVSRWPDFVYRYFAQKLFTIGFPILLVGSAPVRILFDVSDWHPMIGMVAAILASWLAISFFWRLGLRAYESASS